MASKRFGVNITRTIVLDQTIYVSARDESEAMDKVREGHEAGRGGDPYVDFRRAKGVFKDAEGGEINEAIEVDDAWETDGE